MYIAISDPTTLLTDAQLRRAFPDTSFPATIADLPEGYASVQPTLPIFDPATQSATQAAAAQVAGVWTQQWVVRDLTPAEIEAARVLRVPSSVSPRQIRQALTRAGLRTSVEAAVAAGDQDTKDWYEFATQFERSSPIVAALGVALSVTPLQLDDLWTLAGSL
jgi:hypothetical protein